MNSKYLEQRFDRIDQLLTTINECEAYLDPLLVTPDVEQIPISVIPAPEPLPLEERSESELADDVATKIKRARIAKGWRQKDLADITGIARPNIARLESGRRMPKISTLHKISQALGIPMETLLRT